MSSSPWLLSQDYASHSFHRGGAFFAYQSGVHLQLIKLLGDWKSDSVLLNIRLQSINLISKFILSDTEMS